MTAIVIPAADLVPDSAKLLDALLFSVVSGEYIPRYSVVVCFDACTTAFVQYFTTKYPFIKAIENNGNRLNFAGNSNLGLRYVNRELNEDAVVVNQDCVLPHSKYFDLLKGEGIAVASSVNVCAEPPISSEEIEKLNLSQPEVVIPTAHKKLVGFCMFLSNDLMNKIGYFDESFISTWEDDDICARAILAGFPVEHININVHHYGSRCGSYDGQRLVLNLHKYRIKWSIPVEIVHGDMNHWITSNHVWSSEMREP